MEKFPKTVDNHLVRWYISTKTTAGGGKGCEIMRNLEAEMMRRHVRVENIANLLSKSTRTVVDKIKGRYPFTLPEVFKVRNTYFPGMTIEYLFAEDDVTNQET